MDRRAFVLSLSSLALVGCGGGSKSVGGESAIVTGNNRTVAEFDSGNRLALRTFSNGQYMVYSSAIILTGSGFEAGFVELNPRVPGFSALTRYAVSFVELPFVRSDLNVRANGTQLDGQFFVPVEVTTPAERVKPHQIQLLDRISNRLIPFASPELAIVTFQFTGVD